MDFMSELLAVHALGLQPVSITALLQISTANSWYLSS